jgi:hypothetical protein
MTEKKLSKSQREKITLQHEQGIPVCSLYVKLHSSYQTSGQMIVPC